MKKRISSCTTLALLLVINNVIYSQNDCKVLMPSINQSYSGLCKNGLANGEGEAYGEDHYKGEFKKGLPDGKGTYIWKSGDIYTGSWKKALREGEGKYTFLYMGRDSVIKGIWKDDKYVGKEILAQYVIEYKNSIGRVSCLRVGDRPYVKYKFVRGGGESNSISNLMMQGSSGSESNSASFSGFEQVTFPFQGKITFNAPQAFMGSTLTCELRLTINDSGSWIVSIFY